MRYLILSDLHSNLEATRSVLADAAERGFDRTVVLGDIVGYGADPNEVVDLVRGLAPVAGVRGNHDKAACGITDGDTFNDIARTAVLWTRRVLTPVNREYLKGLPEGPVEADRFLIAHGSPLDEEEYIMGESDAADAFAGRAFDVAFFGHSHFACIFAHAGRGCRLALVNRDHFTLRLEQGRRYLVNPGSIGQPRDHNPKAAYAIFEPQTRRLELHRVEYDVESAQSRIEAEGLPGVLASRLALGV